MTSAMSKYWLIRDNVDLGSSRGLYIDRLIVLINMTADETVSKYLHEVILAQKILNLFSDPNKKRLFPFKITWLCLFCSSTSDMSDAAINDTVDFLFYSDEVFSSLSMWRIDLVVLWIERKVLKFYMSELN